jgi:hypothetical protein
MYSHCLFLSLLFQTSTAPNSWATISLWRRFIQLKDKKNEEAVDVVAQAMEQTTNERENCPAGCEVMKQARDDSLRDHYRKIISTPSQGTIVSAHTLQRAEHPARSCEGANLTRRPNLQIPTTTGGNQGYIYLAQ